MCLCPVLLQLDESLVMSSNSDKGAARFMSLYHTRVSTKTVFTNISAAYSLHHQVVDYSQWSPNQILNGDDLGSCRSVDHTTVNLFKRLFFHSQ